MGVGGQPSAEELQAILKAIPDLFFRLNSEGVFLDFQASNPGDLLLPPEEFLGKRYHDILPPDLAQRFQDAITEVSKSREPSQIEYRLELKGKKKDFEARIIPLLKDEFLILIRNISETKLAEKALRESNERFLLATSAINSAIYDWQIDENRIFWTTGLSEIFGFPKDINETTDQWWADHIHPKDQARVLEEIARQLSEVQDFEVEYRLRDASGVYRYVQDRGRLIKDPQNKIVRVVGSLFDITEKKQAKESLNLMMEVIATASEAEDNRAVTSECLEKICILGGWQLGQAWFCDEKENTLFCSHSFYSQVNSTEFRRESIKLRLPNGSDLPGKVWEAATAVWWKDPEENPNFLRKQASGHSSWKSAFAFPLISDGHIHAIFEFFSTETREESGELLEIAARLGSHLGLVFERKQEREKFRYQAYHDVLTGLPNRTLLQDRFSQALAHARRNNRMVAVLFLDLDRFKNINDRLGHHVGDIVLREIAQRLTRTLREVDTVARLGGDEFTILLPHIEHIQDAAKIAQKIILSFEAPFFAEGQQLQSSTSIGISLYPHDGEDLATLMKNADVALYRAKEKGRNNYQLYTPTMTVTALARLKMEKDLRFALERNQFILYYQPLMDIRTGKVLGVEALLRWQHPDMGLFLPAEFLPTAEDSGYMMAIWEWALKTGCKQLRRWRDAGIPVPLLTMNIPPQELQTSTNLVAIVLQALNGSELDPRSLELEIAHTQKLSFDQAAPNIRQLKSCGIRIAIDDFGSGISSFIDIKCFPIDTVKIDPVFIQGCVTDSTDRAILSSIIALAHGMNLHVIAEGVETEEQVAILTANKCDGIQGFHFCRPLPAESLTEFLAGSL
jgi:diguanylate cyclase (GGDEF)-like protein/PAS domain S-box-containing protein